MNQPTSYITCDIVEKEVISCDIVEKEIVNVKFNVIDVLEQRNIVTGLIQEVPTKLTATTFRTSEEYTSGSLLVFLNGLKVPIACVTETSSTGFTIADTTITGDIVEVEYLELE